jgi:hypothetical protein
LEGAIASNCAGLQPGLNNAERPNTPVLWLRAGNCGFDCAQHLFASRVIASEIELLADELRDEVDMRICLNRHRPK